MQNRFGVFSTRADPTKDVLGCLTFEFEKSADLVVLENVDTFGKQIKVH
jgi:hypothetical protein